MQSDHLQILHQELIHRRERNPAYSLRSFGRDLGISPSALSGLLHGKKGLSAEKADWLAKKMGLNPMERELFLLSVRASHARKVRERKEAKSELAGLKATRKIDPSEIAMAQSWVCQAFLELTELEECEHEAEWFAKRLGLSSIEAKSILSRLLKLGWLEKKEGRYAAKWSSTISSSEVPSAAIRGYHRQILAKADLSLINQEVREREFQSTTFAFDRDCMEDAKKAIREFQQKFSHQFYSASKRKNCVYQLSIQFFRLDQEEK